MMRPLLSTTPLVIGTPPPTAIHVATDAVGVNGCDAGLDSTKAWTNVFGAIFDPDQNAGVS